MNILDSKGTCQKCKENAQSEFIECWLCKQRFHVIECEESEAMVQTSFFKNQWSTIARKWPCITFTCDMCREDAHTKQEIIMSQRVRSLEEMALDTSQKLNAITEMLSSKKEETYDDKIANTRKSYAAVTQETPSLIVIGKAEQEASEEEKKSKMQELKKVAIESKVSLKKVFNNKSGDTVVVCNSAKSKETILPHVNKLFESRKINTPKPKLPTISIPFIEGKYEKDELMTALKNQNEENGLVIDSDNAQVIFVSPMRDQGNDGLHQAVLRVSEDLREKIKLNGNRIFIGSSSCPVYDRFYVKRCNRCQGLHHYQKDCKNRVVCAHCAGEHDTRRCQEDTGNYKCVNCSIAGFDEVNHSAYSFECPTYVAEQEKLKKSIHYYNHSKN